MPKPTVYLETTIIGHLVGWIHPNKSVAARQHATREWWAKESDQFQLFASELVAVECKEGDQTAAAERVKVLEEIEFVPTPIDLARDLATALHDNHAVPSKEKRDALHISLAALNKIEYLLTWNFKHIANPATLSKIESTCVAAGYQPPIICSPDDLPGASDGN